MELFLTYQVNQILRRISLKKTAGFAGYCNNKSKVDYVREQLKSKVDRVFLESRSSAGSRTIKRLLANEGTSLSYRADACLTTKALDDVFNRRGKPEGVTFHSDQGSQYSSVIFRQRLWRYGFQQSMSRRGSVYYAYEHWLQSDNRSHYGYRLVFDEVLQPAQTTCSQ